MKKIFLLSLAALLMTACHQKTADTAPKSANESPALTAERAVTPSTQETTQPTASQAEAPATPLPQAALGTPQNPIKVEPGKPIDFSSLSGGSGKSMDFGEKATMYIDSIRVRAERGDLNSM